MCQAAILPRHDCPVINHPTRDTRRNILGALTPTHPLTHSPTHSCVTHTLKARHLYSDIQRLLEIFIFPPSLSTDHTYKPTVPPKLTTSAATRFDDSNRLSAQAYTAPQNVLPLSTKITHQRTCCLHIFTANSIPIWRLLKHQAPTSHQPSSKIPAQKWQHEPTFGPQVQATAMSS